MPSGLAAIAQVGLTDLVQQIPHRALDAWEFYLENRLLFRVDEPMELGGQPCTLISQPAFLEGILQRATAFEHFELLQGAAVRDLLWQREAGAERQQRVSGVQLNNGRAIAADLVIGADGRNSVVRERANLSLIENPQAFDILWFSLPAHPQFATENVFYSMVRGSAAFGCFQGSMGNLQLGWSLHRDESLVWKTIDWPEKLALAAPTWLATHLRQQADAIERPLFLPIQVGRCLQWCRPGLLLLGDAVHPMSPIRAQGINMALRDVIVALNHLVQALQQATDLTQIDTILPQIQAERELEIMQIQALQQAEVNQAKLLRNLPFLRFGISRCAPLIRHRIRRSWLHRQYQLRQGITTVSLRV
jgi:2-polyprenyl-6-methoxyphenol hydroxylase-like FAD-dependent oxidoreductase